MTTAARAEPDQVATAARGTALNLFGAVFGAIISFVTVGVVTNVYGQAGAGLFFASTAAFTLAANSARLGAESGLTYFVSRFRAAERHAAVPGVIRTGLTATAGGALVLAGAGVLAAPLLGRFITESPDSAGTATTMIRILAVAVPTYSLSQCIFGAARGFGTMRPAVLVGQVARPLAQLSLVLVVIVTTDEVWPLALAWAVSSFAAMVAGGAWLRGRVGELRTRVSQRSAEARAVADKNPGGAADAGGDAGDSTTLERGEYLRFTGPRALSDLLSASLERLDVLLVAVYLGEVGAGAYGASNRLILAGQLMMMATAQSMAPLLSASFLKGRNDDAQRALRTISGWNVTLLWPAFICLAFGARTALSVFGSEFAEASNLVVILSVAFLVITGLGMGDTLLTMTGDSLASLFNHAVALMLMVVASMVLLPSVGLVGAAWAWALSRIVLRSMAVGRVWMTKRIHAFGPPVFTAAAIAIVAYVPAGLLGRQAFGESVAAIGLNVVLGAVVQLVLVLRFRRRLEIDRLVAIVRPSAG